MGSPVYVYTDHKTLINFDAQHDLSQRQLCWQELPSQYKIHISYIQGEEKTVADALLHLPADNVPTMEPHVAWSTGMNATSSISTNGSVLQDIKIGYK